jgi:predicted DNA-binding transcriptional regulator AlpA
MASRDRSKKTKTFSMPMVAGAAAVPELLMIPGPKLRRMIGISAVTLWRWRHDDSAGFPSATSINGRLYFRWPEVQAWLARQQQAA